MTAEYKVIGDVAVITMSNPPVNGLGLSTRMGITDGLTKANSDAAVKSIIITGAGKAFSGGADIREFGSPKAIQEPIYTSFPCIRYVVMQCVNGFFTPTNLDTLLDVAWIRRCDLLRLLNQT